MSGQKAVMLELSQQQAMLLVAKLANAITKAQEQNERVAMMFEYGFEAAFVNIMVLNQGHVKGELLEAAE
jgi:hypothetical protein